MPLIYKKITKHTRAKSEGRVIRCPNCNKDGRVYHFGWSALTCVYCHQSSDKYNWYVLWIMEYRKSYKRPPNITIEVDVTSMVEEICVDCNTDEIEDIALIVARRFNYEPVYEEVQELILDVIDELNPPDPPPIYDSYNDPYGGY